MSRGIVIFNKIGLRGLKQIPIYIGSVLISPPSYSKAGKCERRIVGAELSTPRLQPAKRNLDMMHRASFFLGHAYHRPVFHRYFPALVRSRGANNECARLYHILVAALNTFRNAKGMFSDVCFVYEIYPLVTGCFLRRVKCYTGHWAWIIHTSSCYLQCS